MAHAAGIVSATFYLTTYYTVLRYPDNAAFRRGLATLPVFSFLTFGTICAFMVDPDPMMCCGRLET